MVPVASTRIMPLQQAGTWHGASPFFYNSVVSNKDVEIDFNTGGSCRTIQFTGTTTLPGLTDLQWDFGDGTRSSGTSVTHLFPSTGDSFRVVLTARDPSQCGLKRTSMKILNFTTSQLEAGFESRSTFCGNTEIRFEDRSLTATGQITEWYWDFGDGETSTQQHPNHIFTSFGDFPVRLIITANDFCLTKDTVTRMVSLRAAPKADFLIKGGCIGDTVVFINSSTIPAGNIASQRWLIDNVSYPGNEVHLVFTSTCSRF